MREQTWSNYIVMFLRMLTSCEIGRRKDFFCPFILVRAPRLRAAPRTCGPGCQFIYFCSARAACLDTKTLVRGKL